MSYSRWSNSVWYSFYNVNGCFSLWFVGGEEVDHSYSECNQMKIENIMDIYKCTLKEAKEAMGYIKLFIKDYEDDLHNTVKSNKSKSVKK